MPHPTHPEFRPGLPADPMTINRIADSVRTADRDLYRSAPDESRFPANVPFTARVTSNVGERYAWHRLCTIADGEDSEDGWGLSGTVSGSSEGTRLPARAIDRSTTVPANTDVLMWYSDDGQEMRFLAPGGASLTIEEVDGDPSVLAATKLQLPNDAMSSPSAGVARLLEASAMTGGTLTLSNQRLGAGTKSVLAPDAFRIDSLTGGSASDYGVFDSNALESPDNGGGLGIRIRTQISAFYTQFALNINSGGRGVLSSNAGTPGFCIVDSAGLMYIGSTGTPGPGFTVVGGIIDSLGTGTFGDASYPIDLTSEVDGTLPEANGGTGQTSFEDALVAAGGIDL